MYLKVIELSIKEKWSRLAKLIEFRWFRAIDQATMFGYNSRNYVLFDKQKVKFTLGDDFELI